MISTSKLGYTYRDAAKMEFPDLGIKKGERWLLLGESGSGKTTLLHLLGGLLRSQQGQIRMAGTDITSLSESGLDVFRGQHIGFVFQRNHLITALSVRRNLLLAPYLAHLPMDEHRLAEVILQLGLSGKEHAPVASLSQGQAQRVAIARAVLNKPAVILADEPTSALDDRNCERVIDLLLNASEQNQATLVVATHDLRLKSKIVNQVQL